VPSALRGRRQSRLKVGDSGGLMRFRLLAVVLGAAVVIPMSFGIDAQPDEKMNVTRDLAARVGQILGGAGACRDIAPARIRSMGDKLESVFSFATGSADDLNALKQIYERAGTRCSSA